MQNRTGSKFYVVRGPRALVRPSYSARGVNPVRLSGVTTHQPWPYGPLILLVGIANELLEFRWQSFQTRSIRSGRKSPPSNPEPGAALLVVAAAASSPPASPGFRCDPSSTFALTDLASARLLTATHAGHARDSPAFAHLLHHFLGFCKSGQQIVDLAHLDSRAPWRCEAR